MALYGGGERPEHSPHPSLIPLAAVLYGGGERPEHSPHNQGYIWPLCERRDYDRAPPVQRTDQGLAV